MKNSISSKATDLMAATIAIAVLSVTSPAPASAATISYDLTGNTNNVIVQNPSIGAPYSIDDLFLTNAATGFNQLPGFTLNVGDTINGTVTFSSPFTMPASTAGVNFGGEILLDLVGTGNASNIYFPESLTYYDNGLQVSPPSGLHPFGGSGGDLTFGEFALNTPTPSFTFDKIVFSGTVTEILDDSFQNISSANLTSANPVFTTITYPATAPEPATAWFALSVLAGFGVLAWRRNRAA